MMIRALHAALFVILWLSLLLSFGLECRANSGDTARWQSLIAAVPQPPAALSAAFSQIAARRVGEQIEITISDAALKKIQFDADALMKPESAASAAIIQKNLNDFNNDPKARKMAAEIDKALNLNTNSDKPPTREQIAKLNSTLVQMLEQDFATRDIPPGNDIAAYRRELLRGPAKSRSIYQRLFDLRFAFAKRHAELDRVARAVLPRGRTALARKLVDDHQELARQQLIDTIALYQEARTAMMPVFDHMARLAIEAERRGAPATELVQAYSLFKNHVEQLLTINRLAIEDAGFWAGIQPRTNFDSPIGSALHSLYEFSLEPNVDLRANGEAPMMSLSYPMGRASRPGFALGIH